MNQLSMDFAPAAAPYSPDRAARRSDPATSHAAAAQAKDLAACHHGLILGALRARGPAGKDAIAAATGLDGHRVGKRLAELQRGGLIALTGRTVDSKAGRAEREWRMT